MSIIIWKMVYYCVYTWKKKTELCSSNMIKYILFHLHNCFNVILYFAWLNYFPESYSCHQVKAYWSRFTAKEVTQSSGTGTQNPNKSSSRWRKSSEHPGTAGRRLNATSSTSIEIILSNHRPSVLDVSNTLCFWNQQRGYL